MSSPLPWDEAWLPVALPAVAVLLAGLALRSLLPLLVTEGRRYATIAASVGLAAFGWVAGMDAVPPDLAGASATWLGGLLGAFLAVLGALLPWRRRAGQPRGEPRAATVILGLGLGLLPLLAWEGAEHALAFDDVHDVGETRARWRRRMAPSDPHAWLALALAERRRERLEHALGLAAVADELDRGPLRAEVLELRSDIHAARGECDQARAFFDQALEARARQAMETLDLDLTRSYRLPRTLAAECGLTPDSESDSESDSD